jgi:transposase
MKTVKPKRRVTAPVTPAASRERQGAPTASKRAERRAAQTEKWMADLPPGGKPTSASTHSEMQETEAEGRPAVRKVALDLGKKKTTYCEVAKGEVIRRLTVSEVTSLETVLGPKEPEAVVAIEACREAWYVHDLLQSWGNQVVMVDTTRSRRIGVGQHGRKTDRLDAEALARALEHGAIPKAHVLSPGRRELRRLLGVRRALIEARANFVTTVRGLARERGASIPSCTTSTFVKRARVSRLPDDVRLSIAPLLNTIERMDIELVTVEGELVKWCDQEPLITQLATTPGVGAVVAAAFVSVIDEAGRFASAHHVESYLGLVPNEDSTGGNRRLGAITKNGNSYLRSMLIQGAWGILCKADRNDPLRLWGERVADRRGKRIAVVAIARRLVGVLWAMWRDGTVYDPAHLAQQGAKGLRGSIRKLEQSKAELEQAKEKTSLGLLNPARRARSARASTP